MSSDRPPPVPDIIYRVYAYTPQELAKALGIDHPPGNGVEKIYVEGDKFHVQIKHDTTKAYTNGQSG